MSAPTMCIQPWPDGDPNAHQWRPQHTPDPDAGREVLPSTDADPVGRDSGGLIDGTRALESLAIGVMSLGAHSGDRTRRHVQGGSLSGGYHEGPPSPSWTPTSHPDSDTYLYPDEHAHADANPDQHANEHPDPQPNGYTDPTRPIPQPKRPRRPRPTHRRTPQPPPRRRQ